MWPSPCPISTRAKLHLDRSVTVKFWQSWNQFPGAVHRESLFFFPLLGQKREGMESVDFLCLGFVGARWLGLWLACHGIGEEALVHGDAEPFEGPVSAGRASVRTRGRGTQCNQRLQDNRKPHAPSSARNGRFLLHLLCVYLFTPALHWQRALTHAQGARVVRASTRKAGRFLGGGADEVRDYSACFLLASRIQPYFQKHGIKSTVPQAIISRALFIKAMGIFSSKDTN